MNYIILDLEWNQPLYSAMTVREPIFLHSEIVQIGAVKLNENFEETDTFTLMVSPKYYTKMHRTVRRLTKITNELLQSGIPFKEAFDKFMAWCGEDFVFLTWGPDDVPVLRDNIILHAIVPPAQFKVYNLQIIFDSQITKEHRQVSLSKALEAVNEVGEDAHNALNDAKNTALVCKHLDMPLGINEYSERQKSFNKPYDGGGTIDEKEYRNKVEALKDPELHEFVCPKCGGAAVCSKFVKQSMSKSLAVAKCENGGEFIVRLKFSNTAQGAYKVKRSISPLDDASRQLYEEKKALNSKNRKRKKSVT